MSEEANQQITSEKIAVEPNISTQDQMLKMLQLFMQQQNQVQQPQIPKKPEEKTVVIKESEYQEYQALKKWFEEKKQEKKRKYLEYANLTRKIFDQQDLSDVEDYEEQPKKHYKKDESPEVTILEKEDYFSEEYKRKLISQASKGDVITQGKYGWYNKSKYIRDKDESDNQALRNKTTNKRKK